MLDEIGLKLIIFGGSQGGSQTLRTHPAWITKARGRKMIQLEDRMLLFYQEVNSRNLKQTTVAQVCKNDLGPLKVSHRTRNIFIITLKTTKSAF